MNFRNFEEINDEFFSRLDEELPNFNFLPEETFSMKPFLSNPQPMNSLFEEPSSFNLVYSSESQDSSQTGEPYIEMEESSKKDSEKNLPDPISKKSRKISKKEPKEKKGKKEKKERKERKPRGKVRTAKITESTVLAGEIPEKYIPEDFNNPDLDDKTKKKMLQAIRNRVAAQNSRDKKKGLYSVLEEKNEKLTQENMELKERVRLLEESNVILKQENQEYKTALAAARAYQTEDGNAFQKGFLENGFLKSEPVDFSESGMGASTESSNESGSTSPIVRRPTGRSGGYMKYSLALATIFAVMMFNGIHSPEVAVTNNNSLYVPTTNSYDSYAPSSKVPQKKGRILLQEDDLDDEMDIESANLTCVSSTYDKFSYANYLSPVEQNINQQFMSQFFSQIKIYEPVQQLNADQTAKKESDFPSYISASRNQFSASRKNKASEGGVSSMFCPAGFEFNRDADNSNLNGQPETKTGKQLKLKDSEYLQLFIPKKNISIADSGNQNDHSITPQEKNDEDNTMLEVWCKVFSVKELSTGFSS